MRNHWCYQIIKALQVGKLLAESYLTEWGNVCTIYTGSISEKAWPEKLKALHHIQCDQEDMEDRGFGTQGLCACKGIYFNRPTSKF